MRSGRRPAGHHVRRGRSNVDPLALPTKKPPGASAAKSCGGLHFDLVAEFLDAAGESLEDVLLVVAVEVVRAEVLVLDAVAEHEVDGRKHRGGHREDRLLRPAPAFE